ncbi:IS200/IS605 family accessory protein TnpB-related protein [Streptomyces sp. NPDC059071]|uniref:IS200/IS605 family accessory protein TnpB-related protein n=1 Tax=unclassified Streptomyces TaxID=2593676 RepID=UPI0036698859
MKERSDLPALRRITPSFVVPAPTAVAVRGRLKHLSRADEVVLRLVGAHMGSLASTDLRKHCAVGTGHSAETWAARKRELTPLSSSRWAGSVTKATHDQWALARRAQAAHIRTLEAGVRAITRRLALPVGAKGSGREPGGYRSKREWHAKSRRLRVLEHRLASVHADREAGRVRVVRGGRRLLNTRHHLAEAGLSEEEWKKRWEAGRWFLEAHGETGKRFGNDTIRVSDTGDLSIKLPAPLAHLANAPRGRYLLTATVAFAHRAEEWADRITANRAVAYRITYDVSRGRWYVTASWQRAAIPSVPLATALAHGVVGVDMNADHLAAWRLDAHGNPRGAPRRFGYELSGTAGHRDAQIRHALTRLLHWAKRTGVVVIAIEDLDFAAERTRERHGRRKRFRELISGMPTGRLRARIVSMAAEHGLSVVAVDPAYTSRWGAQHWQQPLTRKNRKTSRHEAASIAIGRRALGHPIRRRAAPPRDDQSDRRGHRTAQADHDVPGRDGPRRHVSGPRTGGVGTGHGVKAGNQNAQHRWGRSAEPGPWQQDPLPLSS